MPALSLNASVTRPCCGRRVDIVKPKLLPCIQNSSCLNSFGASTSGRSLKGKFLRPFACPHTGDGANFCSSASIFCSVLIMTGFNFVIFVLTLVLLRYEISGRRLITRASAAETPEQAIERRLRESKRVEERVQQIYCEEDWNKELEKVLL